MKDKVIVILGPTAVGKTALSIELAKRLSTEIISGDSMLLYKGMDIGTAKPSMAERGGIRHHLIDILQPGEEYSVSSFQQDAGALIHAVNLRGRIPIIAGGTGLYLKALLEGYDFNETEGSIAFRKNMEQLAELHGKEYVHALLAKTDPQTAERLHVNDFRRVVRALEVRQLGGEYISQVRRTESSGLQYEACVLGLTMERAALYERINKRVDMMLKAGFADEVKGLLDAGVSFDSQAMKAIGYRELAAYLDGRMELTAAAEEIKKATRHFAKRQLTWYRRMPYINWFDSRTVTLENILEIINNKFAGEKPLA